MRKWLLVLVIVSLFMAALPVLAQDETLDQTYVSQDGLFTFDYPSDWKFDVDIDGTAMVWDNDTTVYIYGPKQVAARDWGMDEPAVMVERLMTRWGKEGDEVSAVEEMLSNERPAALGYYVHDQYPGFVMIIELSDGLLGGIEVVGNPGEKFIAGEDMALAIAESFDVVEGASYEMGLGDLNNAWLDAVNEMSPGGN